MVTNEQAAGAVIKQGAPQQAPLAVAIFTAAAHILIRRRREGCLRQPVASAAIVQSTIDIKGPGSACVVLVWPDNCL